MNLIDPLHNCEKTVIELVRSQGIKVTNKTIRKSLEEHPDYPSLLSVSDFLTSYNIDNIAVKTNVSNLNQLPVPLIAHISEAVSTEKLFILVREIAGEKIIYNNPKRAGIIEENLGVFKNKFTGNVLLLDSTEAFIEKDFTIKQRKENHTRFLNLLTLLLIPFCVLFYIVSAFVYNSFYTVILSSSFLLLTLIGTSICFLLLLLEIDEHNPIIKEICKTEKRINCSATLNSSSSKFLGTSWSSIGFCYFLGMLLSLLLISPTNVTVLSILSFLTILSAPYIFFSIYYQWRILKQWCLLCLGVIAILFLQSLIVSIGGFYNNFSITQGMIEIFFKVFMCFGISTLAVYITLPALKKSKESKANYNAFQRLKNNSQVFEAILYRQKKIQTPTAGLGITIGNRDAKWEIIKVCNPYCDPCAKVHPVVEEILKKNPHVQLQIIFATSAEDSDKSTLPARHLMALASNEDDDCIKKALDEWYNAEIKDYLSFAEANPINEIKFHQQFDNLKAMRKWCEDEQISFTPTLFINGYQLPEMFSVNDLKYFLAV